MSADNIFTLAIPAQLVFKHAEMVIYFTYPAMMVIWSTEMVAQVNVKFSHSLSASIINFKIQLVFASIKEK